MTVIAALIVGVLIGIVIGAWRRPERDHDIHQAGVEHGRDLAALEASKAHHPTLTVVPHTSRCNVIPIDRHGPEPAA